MLRHLGIILDGNRRFAKKLMLQPWKGHEWGAKKVRKLLDWSKELGIKELTLYTFSVQNMNRPQQEREYLFDLFGKEFDRLNQPEHMKELMENGVRINFLGRLHLFGKELQEKMLTLMEKTKKNSKYIVNFAMAYGGREEILDAINALAVKIREGTIEEVNEELFEKYLYNSSEPDLIIRTGGTHRTSNFLPWQSTYSELLFLDKPWPEFERTDLVAAVNDFNSRERRFGK